MLSSPSTTPKPGLYWFTGGILMENEIIEMKLRFLFHLVHLNSNRLAHEVLEVQRQLELPSLWTQCLQFLRDLDISLEEVHNLSKREFKGRLKSSIFKKNESDLLCMMEPYKKLNASQLNEDGFRTKAYFHELNLSQARIMFAIDTKMLKTIKSHYPSHKDYEDDLWECEHCSRVDSIRHLTRCPAFEELRAGKNLHSNTEDIVAYFQEILNIRLESGQAQSR